MEKLSFFLADTARFGKYSTGATDGLGCIGLNVETHDWYFEMLVSLNVLYYTCCKITRSCTR